MNMKEHQSKKFSQLLRYLFFSDDINQSISQSQSQNVN